MFLSVPSFLIESCNSFLRFILRVPSLPWPNISHNTQPVPTFISTSTFIFSQVFLLSSRTSSLSSRPFLFFPCFDFSQRILPSLFFQFRFFYPASCHPFSPWTPFLVWSFNPSPLAPDRCRWNASLLTCQPSVRVWIIGCFVHLSLGFGASDWGNENTDEKITLKDGVYILLLFIFFFCFNTIFSFFFNIFFHLLILAKNKQNKSSKNRSNVCKCKQALYNERKSS